MAICKGKGVSSAQKASVFVERSPCNRLVVQRLSLAFGFASVWWNQCQDHSGLIEYSEFVASCIDLSSEALSSTWLHLKCIGSDRIFEEVFGPGVWVGWVGEGAGYM
eukprot:6367932-Amphidinium_carterae.6